MSQDLNLGPSFYFMPKLFIKDDFHSKNICHTSIRAPVPNEFIMKKTNFEHLCVILFYIYQNNRKYGIFDRKLGGNHSPLTFFHYYCH